MLLSGVTNHGFLTNLFIDDEYISRPTVDFGDRYYERQIDWNDLHDRDPASTNKVDARHRQEVIHLDGNLANLFIKGVIGKRPPSPDEDIKAVDKFERLVDGLTDLGFVFPG